MYLCSFLNILFSLWRLEVIYRSTFSSRSNNQLWTHIPFRLHLEFRLFKFRKTKRSANKKSIPAFWYSIILELWSFMWYFHVFEHFITRKEKSVLQYFNGTCLWAKRSWSYYSCLLETRWAYLYEEKKSKHGYFDSEMFFISRQSAFPYPIVNLDPALKK